MAVSQQDVKFPTLDGLKLAGRLFSAASRGPGVVLLPGFACVKEMMIPDVAESFARAGINALTIDPRNIGSSEGTPRQDINPHQQMSDLSDALTFLRRQPLVDPTRVFFWGFSFGAAVALNAAALDSRVKGVIAFCPLTDFSFGGKKAKVLIKAQKDRESQLEGNEPFCLPVLTEDGENPAGFGVGTAKEDFNLILGAEKTAPTYRNLTTLQTYYHIASWAPFELLSQIKPAALMLTPENDQISLASNQEKIFGLIPEPKQRHVEPGKGHMDILSGDSFPTLMQVQIDFVRSI